jgi:hypothetical protein
MAPLALTLALALGAPVAGEAPAPAPEVLSERRALGIGLLAGGAALLAGTATGSALLEGLTRPDDPDDDPANPEVLQAAAFTGVVLGASGVGLMLAGGALTLSE